jgi:hypothetical protein
LKLSNYIFREFQAYKNNIILPCNAEQTIIWLVDAYLFYDINILAEKFQNKTPSTYCME